MTRRWSATLLVAMLTGCGAVADGVNPGEDSAVTGDGAVADDAVLAEDRVVVPDRPVVTDSVVGRDGMVASDGPIPPADAGAGYSEPLCPQLTDLAAVASAYTNTPAGLRAAARGIAAARYPLSVAFVDVQTDPQLATWVRDRNSFAGVLNAFEVVVHEGQHIWDITMISAQGWPYRVRDDLVIRTRRLTNFNRSEILSRHPDAARDSYARVYLMGQSGAQGFNTLLDEYVAYTHSLASRYCTRDALPRGTRVSARDGILALMFYVGTYLRIARESHPADYAEILADPEHKRLILTVWARAEFLLRTASEPSLGINDAMYRGWAYAPENVAEIDRLR